MTALPDLAATMFSLRREVGPTGAAGDGSGNWQPMVSAAELWVLLDALEAPAVCTRCRAIPDNGPPRPVHPNTMIGRPAVQSTTDPLGETNG